MESTLIVIGGILLGCLLGLSWFAGSDAPYVPTKMSRIRKVLKMANLKKGDIFYELGSGDGRVIIEAAKMGAKAYGIEQSWIRVLLSRWKSRKLASYMSGGNVQFVHGDIFKFLPSTGKHLRGETSVTLPVWSLDKPLDDTPGASETPEVDIRKADLVFIFLLPKGIEKLEPLLKRNLKKGSKVITQTFHFKNWKPYKKILITDKTNPNTRLSKDGKLEGDFWIYKIN
ncbi:hypothetical protein A3F00_03525 [Candidatus Daviesbacteria bacterium RIFCSPHIGHO2_12_FULL_37_11]|uniref:DOT1 domain-containing protein n=1 Tax=Candidatus Daviesbacteria bacterium RIFCSPHIGHO2_12_FULL_37_11 TaxID=1797777 RepID=A0A1F5KCP1_9BACT|nr:MAG: hypothetical protein A2111_00710 [Candidatus Daviesbacteria bacterium GWA1_38_6]OGE18016.1 MAG: hypothetical protein A2769_01115 [Candidatus Daviesbacteria bacterium RIFCSPHIGHO2_01_FULL_37_27]OGE38712.1 MAG: hypothetical protein A3F00_03525 [Candidatus Daviesbacteria bacterium RIFCSPHIGHO2_12_FULL_37_11]OGE45802.1 MAG: hypothetical protein A3B39_01065 [Candidatus Daviesbacteria bacterium RIFCSPLOWO2_01_FULL_37_10]